MGTLIDQLNNLIGTAPEGYEWITYLFAYVLVTFVVYELILVIGRVLGVKK